MAWCRNYHGQLVREGKARYDLSRCFKVLCAVRICPDFPNREYGILGLIFGLWNAHTSLGNILGSVIAGAFVEDNWGLSFIIPGAIIGFMGFMVFLFLVPKPQHVGCSVTDHGNGSSASSEVKHREADCLIQLLLF